MSATFPPLAEQNPKFENMLDLEADVQTALAVSKFQLAGVSLYRKEQHARSLRSAQGKLMAALNEMTEEDMTLYGPYRARVREYYENLKV